MAKQTEQNSGEKTKGSYTKKELKEFLSDIEKKVIESEKSYMYSLLALNHLLRLPNAEKLFDERTKIQAHDLWVKLKIAGFELADPPILFGLPEDALDSEDTDAKSDGAA